jgi:uncharacterized SAM-binding protein YcdF (DUF218 family)
MALFLSKVAALLVYPLGAAILAGAFALALSFTNWRRLGQLLLGSVLVGLWITASPVFADWLNWRVASLVAEPKLEALPPSDAVIVLGGEPLSRTLHALWIYRAGKAPRIVISAGNLPWLSQAVPEAQEIANLLVELGVPRSALVLEAKSRTTRENAVNTAAIFEAHGWRTGLLATSATHMPRALAAFRRVGLDVVPAALETSAGAPQVDSFLDLLPDAGALAWTTSAIKEIIALEVYYVCGWAELTAHQDPE